MTAIKTVWATAKLGRNRQHNFANFFPNAPVHKPFQDHKLRRIAGMDFSVYLSSLASSYADYDYLVYRRATRPGVLLLIVFWKDPRRTGHQSWGKFFSLSSVIRLFKSPRAVLAGWIHYLAFDLMVGLFIVMDAAAHRMSHWLLLPALFMTLMFGPAGLLIYLAMRLLCMGGLTCPAVSFNMTPITY